MLNVSKASAILLPFKQQYLQEIVGKIGAALSVSKVLCSYQRLQANAELPKHSSHSFLKILTFLHLLIVLHKLRAATPISITQQTP